MKCPCSRDGPDRNAKCHMKGMCPHKFDEWLKEDREEKELFYKEKMRQQPATTAAKDRRHFNWIKNRSGR